MKMIIKITGMPKWAQTRCGTRQCVLIQMANTDRSNISCGSTTVGRRREDTKASMKLTTLAWQEIILKSTACYASPNVVVLEGRPDEKVPCFARVQVHEQRYISWSYDVWPMWQWRQWVVCGQSFSCFGGSQMTWRHDGYVIPADRLRQYPVGSVTLVF